MNRRPGGNIARFGSLRLSDVLPMKNHGHEITAKGHVGAVIVTLLFFVLLGIFNTAQSASAYREALGAYLCMAMVYVTYRLCGKRKSGLVLFGAAAGIVALLMLAPVTFAALQAVLSLVSGPLPRSGAELAQLDSLTRLWKSIFGIGLSEELFKAIPVFVALWVGRTLRDQVQRDRTGVWEPLDGIIIGAASAAGFVFTETVFQYAAGQGSSVEALQLEIARMLSSIAGHVAWSGYFGYFIGLAVLRPRHKWPLVAVGWFSAALLHGVWDTFAENLLAIFLIGGLSYVALAASILKARQLSPARPDNFATRVIRPDEPAKFEEARIARRATANADSVAVPGVVGLSLRIGNQMAPLAKGVRLSEHQLPGLAAEGGDGSVAAVDQKPTDPSVLGLRNLSTSPWTATLVNGEQREVPPGRSIRLDRGLVIDFGVVIGRVQ